MQNLFSRILSASLFTVAAALMPSAHAATYTTLNPIQPSDSGDKIEVLEFFSYSCPHCAKIEPLMQAWQANLPDNVVVKGVPVAFNAGMRDLQKLYYALEAIDHLELHPIVFKAIHEEHQQIFDAAAIIDWVAAQGVDKAEFTDAFNSFGVQAKSKRADELTEAYKIDGTPSIAIGGQFVTSPTQTGSYQGTVDQADALVKQLLNQ